MGRLRRVSGWTAVALSVLSLAGCGGSKLPGPATNPVKVTLSPTASVSAQLGSTITFSATAQNAAGTNVSASFTFQSSDTSILDIAPSGLACAGTWNAPLFTVCAPAGVGMVEVTASTTGATSPPTLVFVHPHIDNIMIEEFYTTSPPPTPEPCVPSGQSITLQAKALSQGTDISASVGPFVWSAVNTSVVKLTPIVNSTTNVATNRATALASTPGLTQIFASANGVSSSPFVQPLVNSAPHTVPLDFFETCPVQNITLEVGPAGSKQTSFTVNKGTAQTVTATVTDVFGNILTNAPLTWSSSEPTSVSAATTCGGRTCSVSTAQPGSGTVTASCTPPTCNVGFPLSPAGLAFPDLQVFVPMPVYATTAISGVVSGATTTTNVLASSLDCQDTNGCTTVLYNVSSSTNQAGVPVPIPTPPNSLKFDPTGAKAYMGSRFGAQSVTPSNLGTSNSAFSALGTVTGQLLAISPNGNLAVFSDTVHTPNQVFIVGTASTSTALNISGAIAAGFSPDGLKAFILGCASSVVPCQDSNGKLAGDTLYVYSALQSLQTIPLQKLSNGITFSSNGAFAFISSAPSLTVSPSLTAYNVCNNQISVDSFAHQQVLPLSATSAFVQVLPGNQLNGLDSQGQPFPDVADGMHIAVLDTTGLNVFSVSVTPPVLATTAKHATSLCPQFLSDNGNLNNLPVPPQRIELGQGTFDPLNFFVSPDATKIYIVAKDRSLILVYDFNTGAVSGIPLANDVVTGESVQPVAADMSVDRTLLYVGGSDGSLHRIDTISAVDLLQISFPSLPNFHDAFCTEDPLVLGVLQPCALGFVAVKP